MLLPVLLGSPASTEPHEEPRVLGAQTVTCPSTEALESQGAWWVSHSLASCGGECLVQSVLQLVSGCWLLSWCPALGVLPGDEVVNDRRWM